MSPREAIRAIAASKELDPSFPDGVLAEAEALAGAPGFDDPTLVDRTDLPLVTIDEETSKDLDQALFIEQRPAGWRVWYAIADAAHFVRPGTALFREALRRGSSFYLPGLVIPMLPRVLSEGVVSLNPGVDRRALLFRVDLDELGKVEVVRVERARVRSRVKTWYDAVQEWFDGRRLCPGGPQVAQSLRALREVGRLRLALAESRDVVQFRRAELRVHLHHGDATFVAARDLRNDVERWNEQISLLCNIEGARMLLDAADHVQPIFRTHQPPEPERLDRLRDLLEALIEVHTLDPGVWRWRRSERSLADWLASLPHEGTEGRIARAIHRQALLSTGRAAFTSEPGRHYGVGAEVYARFTAPMREMVGVFTHKECWEHLGESPWDSRLDEQTRASIIEVSARTRKVQRELDEAANRLVLDALFERDLALPDGERPARSGTVMGVSRSKVHIQLDEPPIDVKVYIHHLARQSGQSLGQGEDRATLRVNGTDQVVARVGEPVRVQVVGRDGERDRWELSL